MPTDRTVYLAEWHKKNRQRRLAKMRADYRLNPQTKIAKTKAYLAQHPEISRKSWRKYQVENRELCRERNRKYYQEHKTEQQVRCRNNRRKYFAAEREKILARNRRWSAHNKDKIRQRDLRRKALLKGARINLAHIREWMESVKSKPFAVCYYCDLKVSTKAIHFDHIVALAKGGSHTVENLCVSCGSCNCSKQARDISAWIRIGQQVLAL